MNAVGRARSSVLTPYVSIVMWHLATRYPRPNDGSVVLWFGGCECVCIRTLLCQQRVIVGSSLICSGLRSRQLAKPLPSLPLSGERLGLDSMLDQQLFR